MQSCVCRGLMFELSMWRCSDKMKEVVKEVVAKQSGKENVQRHYSGKGKT